VSVLAAGPFNSGLLARPWPTDDATFEYAPASAELPAVVSVVAGMRTAGEAAANAALIERSVPAETWALLEEVTARPR
jgi:D-threo-aldose 1-dehydrogenase